MSLGKRANPDPAKLGEAEVKAQESLAQSFYRSLWFRCLGWFSVAGMIYLATKQIIDLRAVDLSWLNYLEWLPFVQSALMFFSIALVLLKFLCHGKDWDKRRLSLRDRSADARHGFILGILASLVLVPWPYGVAVAVTLPPLLYFWDRHRIRADFP
jgi:hypothetical protein